jgi:hypothetical protein
MQSVFDIVDAEDGDNQLMKQRQQYRTQRRWTGLMCVHRSEMKSLRYLLTCRLCPLKNHFGESMVKTETVHAVFAQQHWRLEAAIMLLILDFSSGATDVGDLQGQLNVRLLQLSLTLSVKRDPQYCH